MSWISNFRDSGKLSQLLMAAAALLGFAVLALFLMTGVLLYGVISPPTAGGELSLDSLLGRPTVISFPTPGGSEDGWFFPGRSTAPTILLAHGYLSNREEVLTLVTSLQEHQYNVFVFDLAGHGRNKHFSTLGYRETQELLAAINTIAARDDVDRTRFGVWGTSVGAYAAASAAGSDPRIRAIVLDSVYNDPVDFLDLQIERSGLNVLPFTTTLCHLVFRTMNFSGRKAPPLSERLPALPGVAKLFVMANDNRALGASTAELFGKAANPKQQINVPKSNYASMTSDDKHNYENNIVGFFLENLPPVGGAPPPR
ncbi:MAG: alpha/beta fold hydrolase [Acidobacteria bacterium]|nr:alpha/beta fold hydrolase [Acidobacteriota bacterium]MCL5287633.1 alpha/beta fold hydrolase [Acidobacteriota bacterium]